MTVPEGNRQHEHIEIMSSQVGRKGKVNVKKGIPEFALDGRQYGCLPSDDREYCISPTVSKRREPVFVVIERPVAGVTLFIKGFLVGVDE